MSELNNTRIRPNATSAPMSCIAMNAGAEAGAIPAKVSENIRFTDTIGLAKLVDEVKRRLPIWKRQVFPDGDEEWVACP